MNQKDKGNAAEHLAAAFLERKGFQILERNFRCRAGEIDLIAKEGGLCRFRRGQIPEQHVPWTAGGSG